jgi:hypothetical protein
MTSLPLSSASPDVRGQLPDGTDWIVTSQVTERRGVFTMLEFHRLGRIVASDGGFGGPALLENDAPNWWFGTTTGFPKFAMARVHGSTREAHAVLAGHEPVALLLGGPIEGTNARVAAGPLPTGAELVEVSVKR